MSVTEEVRKYVVRHYGNLISADKPRFDAESKTWLAELKCDYPRAVHDDRSPNERILNFISLRRLGEIKLGEDFRPKEDTTSREACIQNLSSFLEMWQKRAERIIIRVSSDRLACTNEAQWILAKVGMLVSSLWQRGIIFEQDIASFSPNQESKIRRYLQFLEGLDLTQKTEEGYTYGNLFAALRDKFQNIHDFKTAILSHIIRERYSTLRETFGISQLEPFVHVDSCYYKPALEAERLPYWTISSIIKRYTETYGRKPPLRIMYVLEELVAVDALKHEDKYYFGNAELFSQMLDLKSQMSEISPCRA